MTLNGIMSAATSGLHAAQTGLRTVSDNIANVDTPGYIRKVADQVSVSSGGAGVGVSVSQIRLASDRFLQQAALDGTSDAGSAGAAYSLWDQTQGLFGDPSESASFFSSMDRVFSAFSTLASQPNSSAARTGALDQAARFFEQAGAISEDLLALRAQADARIKAGVEQVNQLLTQIDALNQQISRSQIMEGDASGPANEQTRLINELSALMDVKVTPRPQGGVNIRASDGLMLAGDGAAVLSYDSGVVGEVWVKSSGGQTQLMGSRITSGEIAGLIELRNKDLPAVSAQLSELVSQTADQINRIHNAHSSVPAPTALTGRNTGLDATTAMTGFTGQTTIALVDATTGVLQRQVDVDFDGGTMSVDGGAAIAFTPATFVATLNGAMAPMGGAGFAGGALSLTGAGGRGVAVQDNAADPSLKTGRGFSAYFGLNDLVSSIGFAQYDTGLTAASAHGFTPGQEITFRIMGPDGARLTDVKVAVPVAATMNDLLTSLNATAGGVGFYGSFSLDADGQMAFSPTPGSGRTLSVVDDDTTRGVGGPSMSAFFGIGQSVRAARATGLSIRADIAQDPSHLALAKLNLAASVGTPSLSIGDTRGADALALAGQSMTNFEAAGAAGAVAQRLSDYAAGLSGHVARKAEAAEDARTAATAISAEADARRSSVEGVNLDQELIQLTTYQQAYNASARMIQAVNEMYEVLLGMTN
jgi:flagellar hook-associated protein 1 FlgK